MELSTLVMKTVQGKLLKRMMMIWFSIFSYIIFTVKIFKSGCFGIYQIYIS